MSHNRGGGGERGTIPVWQNISRLGGNPAVSHNRGGGGGTLNEENRPHYNAPVEYLAGVMFGSLHRFLINVPLFYLVEN